MKKMLELMRARRANNAPAPNKKDKPPSMGERIRAAREMKRQDKPPKQQDNDKKRRKGFSGFVSRVRENPKFSVHGGAWSSLATRGNK